MIRGLYTAASGLIAGLRQQERVANNLANANTPGFKGETSAVTAFRGVLARRIGSTAGPLPINFSTPLGRIGTGVYQTDREADFSEGVQRVTGEMLDVALEGQGFFAIRSADGVRYTRDGHFGRAADGTLVTAKGDTVLDVNGEAIQIGGGEVVFRSTGVILVDGVETTTLRIVILDADTAVRASDTEFESGFGPAAVVGTATDAGVVVRQGSLEGSNVDMGRTATDMIAARRNFSSNQSVFSTIEETLERAVNDIGRVR